MCQPAADTGRNSGGARRATKKKERITTLKRFLFFNSKQKKLILRMEWNAFSVLPLIRDVAMYGLRSFIAAKAAIMLHLYLQAW